MTGYCKHCHQTHAVWTRLNNGVICGLCGTRERDLRVTPVNAQTENRRAPLVPTRVGRPSF